MPVSVDASKTLIDGVAVSTWANRPTTVDSSQLYLFTDIGASGTLMRYAGSRWRPLAGQAMLASLGAAVSGITNSETIVLQALIPAGAWQTNDTIRLFINVAKSGATDAANINVRIGTAGTTADTAITGLGPLSLLNAAGRAGGFIFDIKQISGTSAQKVGTNGGGIGSYGGTLSGVASVATTITDASANALYVSVGFVSSGTTDTVTVSTGQIQLITP